jgi:IclR family pca regulon transcriptional regulator
MTIQAIMAVSGLSRATAYRTLEELTNAGWVNASGRPRRYQGTNRIVLLGLHVLQSNRAREVALSHAMDYVRATGKLCVLGTYENGSVLFIDSVTALGDRLTVSSRPTVLPAPYSAVGKILLAYQSADEIHRVASRGLPKMTERTKTTPEAILQDLEDARRNGFAVAYQEYSESSRGLAVPVFNADGTVTIALGINALQSPLLDEQLKKLAEGLRIYSERASVELGYCPPHVNVVT